MERAYDHSNDDHVIDIVRRSGASSSSSTHAITGGLEERTNELQSSASSRSSVYESPVISSGQEEHTARHSLSLVQGGNSQGRQRNPLNSVLWISVDILLNVSQIIAAIIILYLSKNEKPRAPLRHWILGYASGCFCILPFLFWRFKQRNLGSEQGSTQRHVGQGNSDIGAFAAAGTTNADGQVTGSPNPRLKAFIEYLKLVLDCFFAIWFVVGNIWIFGWHSSVAEAPYLYRLCIIFLVFSCIGYAIPFILCAAICCCLPCLLSIMGLQEDFPQNKGATQESINSLPTYKFKENKAKNSAGEYGIVAAGTEKERALSGEDAVCSICLSKYVNNDELRELPCPHLFHRQCVDKWLKINASCPLCKAEVGETLLASISQATAHLRGRTIL